MNRSTPHGSSWPEILARAISGLRAATGYPHVYSIAAHANAPRKDLGNRGACPTTRYGASAVVIRIAGGLACGGARRLRQHRLVGRSRTRARVVGAIRRRRQQQLHDDERRQQAVTAVDTVGQGKLGGRTRAEREQLSRPERANPGRMFADGMGEQRQGPATLVCAAVPGRRLRRSPVRRLRQSLRRPAGSVPVFPGDPVDTVAPTGDRDAVHPKVFGGWPAAGQHTPGTGAGFRRAPWRGGRQPAGPGGRDRPDGFDARAGRLCPGAARLPGRGRPRLLDGQRDGGAWRLAAGCSRGGAGRTANTTAGRIPC